MQHFVLTVVEAETIPCRVLAATTVMEILIAGTIKFTETLQFVLHRMAMHEVHDDMHSTTVGIIDEGFEFIGRSETAAGSKEIRYMVSEGSVIRVLLNGHNLHAVIAQLIDTRQHITTELLVRIHFLFLGTHADMALVDEQSFVAALSPPLWGGRVGFSILPLILGFIPNLGREYLRLLVLHHAAHIRRDTLSVTAVPLDEQFVHLAMSHRFLRQLRFPYAISDRLQTISLVLLPVVHVALDINRRSVRCPLTQHPSFWRMMQAKIEISGRPLGQRLTTCDLFLLIHRIVITTLESTLVRLQIRITLNKLEVFRFFTCCHSCMCFSLYDSILRAKLQKIIDIRKRFYEFSKNICVSQIFCVFLQAI